jgi:hypothetical protein
MSCEHTTAIIATDDGGAKCVLCEARFVPAYRLDSALAALTEIYRLATGIELDDMTMPEIGTIALGAIQTPLVERHDSKKRVGYFCKRCKTQHITNETPERCLCGSPDIQQLYDEDRYDASRFCGPPSFCDCAKAMKARGDDIAAPKPA